MNFLSSYVSKSAYREVQEVLKSSMLSEGEVTRKFERELEKVLGFREYSVICTNSGTSALHLAMRTLGIGVGDEVILPPITFVATGLAILYCGATPVFCDIDKLGNLDPQSIKITEKTKAIVTVNWAGHRSWTNELKKFGLPVIVDAAQSFGYGIDGDITCLSFQATKHITTGDGGAVIFNSREQYSKARKLNWFGIDRDNNLPGVLGERVYDLRDVGYKYHMNNVAAAIGLANLRDWDYIEEHHQHIADIYNQWLPSFIGRVHWGDSAFWAYPIEVDDVTKFSVFCRQKKIPCSVIHRGINHNRIFGGQVLKNQKIWEQTITHLPVHMDINEDEAGWICKELEEYETWN